ncbi:unnamed protein product [Vitrella brassicaformis CCMP3155]|uniref:Uncharacterized protein n=1 Tax=Vitrella brassicaformis (strain CCMP3155) TaxID=1169540 RepID=A0A0G4ENT5_VITBC|nr:unnamed protein product [Vitrella brassicaformis CCMP3155]|eukprot:CEL98740.1 unnamed protein product [Vitrella brassicaformis CCMP3155]
MRVPWLGWLYRFWNSPATGETESETETDSRDRMQGTAQQDRYDGHSATQAALQLNVQKHVPRPPQKDKEREESDSSNPHPGGQDGRLTSLQLNVKRGQSQQQRGGQESGARGPQRDKNSTGIESESVWETSDVCNNYGGGRTGEACRRGCCRRDWQGLKTVTLQAGRNGHKLQQSGQPKSILKKTFSMDRSKKTVRFNEKVRTNTGGVCRLNYRPKPKPRRRSAMNVRSPAVKRGEKRSAEDHDLRALERSKFIRLEPVVMLTKMMAQLTIY